MGLDHQVAFREDGTAAAWTAWSKRPRRTLIRLDPSRNGGVKPRERGKHRAAAIDELGNVLRAHGVSVTERERRGPESDLPASEVVAAVNRLRSAGQSAEAACAEVAKERHYSVQTVRRKYWDNRKKELDPVPEPEPQRPLDGPRGPDLLRWIERIKAAEGVSFSTAARHAAEARGWTSEQLRRQLVGTWQSTSRGWTLIDADPKQH